MNSLGSGTPEAPVEVKLKLSNAEVPLLPSTEIDVMSCDELWNPKKSRLGAETEEMFSTSWVLPPPTKLKVIVNELPISVLVSNPTPETGPAKVTIREFEPKASRKGVGKPPKASMLKRLELELMKVA